MKIIETDFSEQILKFVKNKIGNIFFFNHVAVVEINDGVHFNLINAPLIIDELVSYFGDTLPYGVIANRVNSYSVDLLQTPNFKESAKNLYAYGVVGHDLAGKMNAEMENDFCAADNIDYDNIYEAIHKVYKKVQSSGLFALR